MTRTLTQITADALKLPPKARGKLIDRLFDALDPVIDRDAEAQWKSEVARLVKLDREGKLHYKSADKVLNELKGMLKK